MIARPYRDLLVSRIGVGSKLEGSTQFAGAALAASFKRVAIARRLAMTGSSRRSLRTGKITKRFFLPVPDGQDVDGLALIAIAKDITI